MANSFTRNIPSVFHPIVLESYCKVPVSSFLSKLTFPVFSTSPIALSSSDNPIVLLANLFAKLQSSSARPHLLCTVHSTHLGRIPYTGTNKVYNQSL